MSDTQKIVVRVRPNHPSGTRRRAWFVFGTQPSRVEVTAEELKLIQEDEHLIIVTKWTWLDQATDQKKWVTPPTWTSGNDDSEKPPLTKKQIIEQLEEMKVKYDKRANRDDLLATLEEAIATAWSSSDGPNENLAELSIEQLVAKLEAKWLVEGTDFTKDADKADLIELLLA